VLEPTDPKRLSQDPELLTQMLVPQGNWSRHSGCGGSCWQRKSCTRCEQVRADQLGLFVQDPGIAEPAAEEEKDDTGNDQNPPAGSEYRHYAGQAWTASVAWALEERAHSFEGRAAQG